MSEINDLLEFDALAEAERATGSSYKDNEATMLLGMLLMAEANERVKDEMMVRDDTHYGVLFADALRILGDLGFEEIHSHDFHPAALFEDEQERTEKFIVLWRAGVLAKITSYGEKVNNFNLYYNWEPNEDVSYHQYTSSGRFNRESYDAGRKVWVGDHDVQTGLRHILNRLESNGQFLDAWLERPFLWFVDYAQEKGDYDYKAITASVIETFPEEIRKAMGPERA